RRKSFDSVLKFWVPALSRLNAYHFSVRSCAEARNDKFPFDAGQYRTAIFEGDIHVRERGFIIPSLVDLDNRVILDECIDVKGCPIFLRDLIIPKVMDLMIEGAAFLPLAFV